RVNGTPGGDRNLRTVGGRLEEERSLLEPERTGEQLEERAGRRRLSAARPPRAPRAGGLALRHTQPPPPSSLHARNRFPGVQLCCVEAAGRREAKGRRGGRGGGAARPAACAAGAGPRRSGGPPPHPPRGTARRGRAAGRRRASPAPARVAPVP